MPDERHEPFYAPTSASRLPRSPLTHRQARIHYSLSLLRSHPAVNPTGAHASYRPPSPPPPSASAPSSVIKALFNDLVRRELGVDPSCATPRLIDAHRRRTRSVVSAPSLSTPAFVTRLATPLPPSAFGDKSLIASVAPSTVPKMRLSTSAAQVHRAIQEARQQHAQLQNQQAASNRRMNGNTKSTNSNAKSATNDVPIRRSTRKRSRHDADLENNHANANESESQLHQHPSEEPPEVTALRPSPESVRRTRSASRKARRSTNNPSPSECCFCPDPEIFGGDEIKSELIGPFVNRRGQAKLFVHFDCACWAPQVFAEAKSGQLCGVFDEYCRGRKLKCSDCGGRGATIGCYVQKCKHVFHFRCLTRSGARRVERFFVAFCANHAHLGEKQSYKILMEAATIADVAEAHRRQDTTFGLDAPHSRYTQLRRRETELIFSRKLGICSHSGAFETSRVIFSHKRRRILGKTDRLCLVDQPRSLLRSAFDVASGRLAYMSVAGKEKSLDNMTAVEARAALASREKSSLFLLRNLRRAPLWTKDQITVVKNSTTDAPKAGEALSGKDSSRKSSRRGLGKDGTAANELEREEQLNVNAAVPSEAPSVSQDGESNGSSSPVRRRSKRRRVNMVTTSDDGNVETNDPASTPVRSAPLPSFKKNLRAALEVSAASKAELKSTLTEVQKSPRQPADAPAPESKVVVEGSHAEKQNGRASPNRKRRAAALCIAQDGKLEDGGVPSSRQGLAGKVKSAWETFLEEQLPKERLLRPDDPEADAMRNMARLWSLLSAEAREGYEEKARRSGLTDSDPAELPEGTDHPSPKGPKRQKKQHVVSKGSSRRVPRLSHEDPGLFAGRERTQDGSGPDGDAQGLVKSTERKRPSVSLPRRSRDDRKRSATGFELVAVDWDEVLPTTLSVDEPHSSSHSAAERVRSPPSQGKRM